jgi:AcrR family transcriptional regulator
VLSGGVAGTRRRGAPVAFVLSRRGDVLVSQTQRSRMLSSAVAVIAERGYGEMSVARITAAAGVSRRTFYDLFKDREDCFIAAFEDTVARAREAMLAGYASEQGWLAQTRAGLRALLLFLDREPGIRSLLVVDALQAGPRVLRRRAEILERLSRALHDGGCRAGTGGELPALTGEAVTGAVLGVIHTRLLVKRPGRMADLVNPLMSVIVLPYLGPEAAQEELSRPAPSTARSRSAQVTPSPPGDPLAGIPMRITYRTLLVLGAIGESPGASNREIADEAGVADQGQISKLLARLSTLGLIENTGPGQPSGEPNQWRLTRRGQKVHHVLRAQSSASQLNGRETR